MNYFKLGPHGYYRQEQETLAMTGAGDFGYKVCGMLPTGLEYIFQMGAARLRSRREQPLAQHVFRDFNHLILGLYGNVFLQAVIQLCKLNLSAIV